MKKITLTLGLAALLLTSLTSVQAALISYDGFTSNVSNGGTGWTTNWSASDNAFNASGISSGNGLISSGGSADIGFYGGGQATRTFSAAPITTGTLWISWLQTSSTAVADPAQIRLLNNGNTLLMFGKHFADAQTFKIFSDGGGSVQGTSSVSNLGTNFVVASMEFATGQVNLYVNPTGLGTGGAPLTGLATSWTSGGHFGSGLNQFQTVGSGGGLMSLDEVRVGTTWAAVSPIPEPSTYAMLAFGLAAVFFLRRRCTA